MEKRYCEDCQHFRRDWSFFPIMDLAKKHATCVVSGTWQPPQPYRLVMRSLDIRPQARKCETSRNFGPCGEAATLFAARKCQP